MRAFAARREKAIVALAAAAADSRGATAAAGCGVGSRELRRLRIAHLDVKSNNRNPDSVSRSM